MLVFLFVSFCFVRNRVGNPVPAYRSADTAFKCSFLRQDRSSPWDLLFIACGDVSVVSRNSLRSVLFSQEQQKETIRLRARITQAAVERATLLAEIKGCNASLYTQQVRSAWACTQDYDRELRGY